MSLLVAALTLAMILVIWFDTDAFVEYFSWLPCRKVKQYLEVKAATTDYISFPNFLAEYSDSFLIRLVTCPTCIAVWASLLISLLAGTSVAFLAVAFLGLSFHKLFHKL